MSEKDRAYNIIRTVLAVIVLVLALAGTLFDCRWAIYVYLPLAAIYELITYIELRKRDKRGAYINLGGAIVVVICLVVMCVI